MKLRAKFVARSLVRMGLTHEWLTLWKTPELEPLAASCPRLLLKPQRLYLAFGLTPEQRWTALREHYAFALEVFSAATLQEVFHTGGVLLATVPTPGVGSFSLRLMYDVAFEMEGELSLVLWDDVLRRRTFTLSFSISSNQPGRRKIFIGGLQGFKAPAAKQQAVDLTRAMFGLRPKALLLFALQQLAVQWDVRQIGAVSNEKHTICGRLPRLRKLLSRLPAVNRIVPPRDMQANYDEFWLESGGRREQDGCFILPVAFEPRPFQSIKRNKRQLYRRRYGLLAALGTEIQKNLNGLTLPTC